MYVNVWLALSAPDSIVVSLSRNALSLGVLSILFDVSGGVVVLVPEHLMS